MTVIVTHLFPLFAAGFSAAAFLWPGMFRPFSFAIVPLLGLVMFGMGLTLQVADFARVARRPGVIALGIGLQYLLMPLFGFLAATGFRLDPQSAAGLILVGCCPGGTASNVVCYLARGNVALSITLTACTTLLAVVATPALTLAYAGHTVPVPALDMVRSILTIVAIPVLAGTAIHTLAPRLVARVEPALPLVSVAAIVLIIAIIVALNRDQIAVVGLPVAAAVVVHNLAGLAGGYGAARMAGLAEAERRTIAIEVGMQNSGLGVALALQYFSAAAALPGALFSVWHNLSGATLAGYWSRRDRG
ncbi:MAG: bile acid:sodium symporter family protein [Alphaproteobacteria bacterium]